jgi:hypothetical protein
MSADFFYLSQKQLRLQIEKNSLWKFDFTASQVKGEVNIQCHTFDDCLRGGAQ